MFGLKISCYNYSYTIIAIQLTIQMMPSNENYVYGFYTRITWLMPVKTAVLLQ